MIDWERHITTAIVLGFLILFVYSKFKKQSMLDSLIEIKEGFQELFGDTEEEIKKWTKKWVKRM